MINEKRILIAEDQKVVSLLTSRVPENFPP
jgi:hypothetical protein